MRIKINDKIYRLKEIESGVDSLMELVEEPKYKDGDFLVKEYKDGKQYIFILDYISDDGTIYFHCYHVEEYNKTRVVDDFGIGRVGDAYHKCLRYATDSEKDLLIAELYKVGKRWNDEKKCIEDIPKRKFKNGDKVRIKDGVSSKTHGSINPCFVKSMDKFIGKELTVENCRKIGLVTCDGYYFLEEWLEPYVEDIPNHKFKKGDKVVLKSGYKKSDGLIYLDVFDLFIGKPLTIKGYTDAGGVYFSDCRYIFNEDWLEPYKELKKGDLAIFWDENKEYAKIGIYLHRGVYHYDHSNTSWTHAIKFESKEQFEKLIKGES